MVLGTIFILFYQLFNLSHEEFHKNIYLKIKLNIFIIILYSEELTGFLCLMEHKNPMEHGVFFGLLLTINNN